MIGNGGITRLLSVVALAGLTIGCGGGGGTSSRSASTAAGVSSQQQTVILQLPSARAEHTATLLASGEILVVGGRDVAGDPLRATVLVSPTAVRPGPDLATARVGHSATVLTTGEVLIAGGQSDKAGATVLDTTELFDPITGTLAAGPKMAQKRARHVAASFNNAQGEHVLFAGGQSGVTAQGAPVLLASAEVLNATTRTSAAIPAALRAAQADARIARLDSGAFLIVGGQAATAAAGADVFDPQARTFTPANPVAARAGVAIASQGREVLVAGGQSSTGPEAATEVYDAQTRTFAQGVRLGQARRDAEVAIVNSELVVIGGRDAAGARGEVDRLKGNAIGQSQVTAGPALKTARYDHTATPIGPTRYAVIGGYDAKGAAIDTIELTDLAVVTSSQAPAAATPTSTGPVALPGGAGTVTPSTSGSGSTTTTIPAGTTASGSTSGSTSGGLAGLLGGLLGGSGSGSTGSGSASSTILNAVLQSALQAFTSTSGSGTGFSGFMQAFLQNLMTNLLGGGGAGSSATSGSGLSGILSSLLGGSTGSTGGSSGLSGILSSLLSSLGSGTGSTGSTGGSSSGLSGILSSLLGGSSGSTGSTGGSSSGLSGLLGSLLGGSGSSTGSTASGSTPGPNVNSLSPGQGRAGDTVVIQGANFSGQTSVAFNGTPAPIVAASNSSITVRVPAGASSGAVTVSTAGTTVLAGQFTVQ